MTRDEELVIGGLGLAAVGAVLLLVASRHPATSPGGVPNPTGEPHQPPPPGKVCGTLGQACGAGCDCCGLWYDASSPPKCTWPPKSTIGTGPCNPNFTSATTVDPQSPTGRITSCCWPPSGDCYLTYG